MLTRTVTHLSSNKIIFWHASRPLSSSIDTNAEMILCPQIQFAALLSEPGLELFMIRKVLQSYLRILCHFQRIQVYMYNRTTLQCCCKRHQNCSCVTLRHTHYCLTNMIRPTRNLPVSRQYMQLFENVGVNCLSIRFY